LTDICDYEGSRYRFDFWEGRGREYEDAAERIALRALLPPSGDVLIEIGAGYGRLADLYQGYHRVVLLDYARTQLEEAQRYLTDPERYTLVVGDVYHLPFVDHLFDTLTMVRVLHHLADVPLALAEVQRVMRPQGVAVLEHASKQHLKAIARWLLRRQSWSPFDPQPVEFADLNFDFHPAWMRQQLKANNFRLEKTRSVSHFRIPLLKRLVPQRWLAAWDGLVQPTGQWWQLTPSVFMRARAQKAPVEPVSGFFCCPTCRSSQLSRQATALVCSSCGRHWRVEGGIYDFKTPLPSPN
jgi:ubiquinone/menaquinone biosynthesis C-methylase UbiE/ribosomal protein L37AE/L43A